jgi:polar amino acid transport system substrate-binding protein
VFRVFFIIIVFSFYTHAKPITITVAAPEIFPFVYLNEKQESVGLFVDCLNNSTHKSDSFNVIVLPWARALEEVKNNRIDALMPAVYTKQRTAFLSYPDTPMNEFFSDILVKKTTTPFTTFADAKKQNKIIAKVRSKALRDDIKARIESPGLTILNIKDTKTALKMLLQNRIDYFVGDPQMIKYTAQQTNMLDKFSFVELSDKTSPSFLAFSKGFAKNHDINHVMSGIHCKNKLIH